MARIKISDIPENCEIKKDDLRKIIGGHFQNFDQKGNQMFNLMASVMKSFNEMRMTATRNLL